MNAGAAEGGAAGAAFRLCPSCGAPAGPGGLEFVEGKLWRCGECGFRYFHNVAAAAGVILDRLGELVFIERAMEPSAGKLGLPGGFVNPGESAEDGAMRECREEIGWAPPELSFLASFPNVYEYRGVAYNTCDLYFYYRFPAGAAWPLFALIDGEATDVRLMGLGELRDEELAFPSLVRAIAAYRSRR